MAYVKQNFKSGETLYALQLNAMDRQIAANEAATVQLQEEKANQADFAKTADKLDAVDKQAAANEAATNRLKADFVTLQNDVIEYRDKSFGGSNLEWIPGWISSDGSIHEHEIYQHTKVFGVEAGTTINYANLRSPADYVAYIACFANGVYVHDKSPLGDSNASHKSGEFVVPDGIDGLSFVAYVDGDGALKEISIAGKFMSVKADNNSERIEDVEKSMAEFEAKIDGNYNEIFASKAYTIADGFDVVGKYYDVDGKINSAPNCSTTGIIPVPSGIREMTYTAYRNTTIPTILFFNRNMDIVGTVMADTAPAYGDYLYSGSADIPATAAFMAFSMLNTISEAVITVKYSRIENNMKRVENLEKDPLYGMKISCTGNSITSAIHSVPGHGYVEQIAGAHGMTVDNHAIWGAIIPQGQTRKNGDTEIGCIHDTIEDMAEDANIVIMSGSINDCEYYTNEDFLGELTGDFTSELNLNTFYGALEDMCKKALQKWQGKPIIYVIEHRMTLDNTTYGQYYLKLHKAIIDVMNKWGISVVDLFNDCPSLNYNDGYKTAYTTGDGTHPNFDGYAKFYVPRVYAEIKRLLGI